MQTDFLNKIWTGWGLPVLTLLVLVAGVRILGSFFLNRLRARSLRTKGTWDDFLVRVMEVALIPLFYTGSVYFFVEMLTLNAGVRKVLHAIFLVATTYFLLRMLSLAVKKLVRELLPGREKRPVQEGQVRGLVAILNAFIWVLGGLFLMGNLGYDVSTLLAGLGIGGIAVALAAQTILGDLFNYFVIFFDRPFETGDFIVMDDKSGTIEQIGVKTTRIRTLAGEQLVCSNTDLTGSRIHNYKRLERRRIVFVLRVAYETTPEQLRDIPGLVAGIVRKQEGVVFDRGHFFEYGEFSLNFEFVYFILNSDYNFFMDVQQAIYLETFTLFREKGIDFAYPARKVFIEPSARYEENPLQAVAES